MLTVIKAGGAWLDGAPSKVELEALAGWRGDVVVVHGGGKEITRWQERCGIPIEWSDGLRVTRGDSLALSSMVLSGRLNKKLVRALALAGRPAVGISGEDGDLINARPIDPARLGAVGAVERVEVEPLEALLAADFTPVVSPISQGASGPLNVNADEAAAHLAMATGADRLYFVSDVPAVRADRESLEAIDRDEAQRLAVRGELRGGMAVKVEQGLRAHEHGVEVRIGDGSMLSDPEAGTRVGAPALATAAT